jgi:hypothetical protein
MHLGVIDVRQVGLTALGGSRPPPTTPQAQTTEKVADQSDSPTQSSKEAKKVILMILAGQSVHP